MRFTNLKHFQSIVSKVVFVSCLIGLQIQYNNIEAE